MEFFLNEISVSQNFPLLLKVLAKKHCSRFKTLYICGNTKLLFIQYRHVNPNPDSHSTMWHKKIHIPENANIFVSKKVHNLTDSYCTMRVWIGVHMSVLNKKLLDSDKNSRKLISKGFLLNIILAFKMFVQNCRFFVNDNFY